MKIIALFALLVSAATAQIHLSFSQQGSSSLITVAGSKIKGQGLVAVTAENLGAADRILDPGAVYSAAGALGISYILPHVAIPTVARTQAFSWPVLGLDGVTTASQIGGALGLTRIVKMSNGWTLALTIGLPLAAKYIEGKLAAASPAVSIVATDLLQAPLPVKAHSTVMMLIVARYQADWPPKEALLP
jgi:hypothetical protein